MKPFDVIVVGLGGMGSAAAYQLARRGQKVLGLEAFTAGHKRGSSHGDSRVIRQAYFEDPAYVPLLLRAYELWAQIENESGQELVTITGGLMMGGPDSPTVSGSQRSAELHGLPHELLDSAEIKRRFPALNPADGEVGLYEPNAGYVRPEKAVQAHLSVAQLLGAELHFEEPVLSWKTSLGGVAVMTSKGDYRARRLVLTAGAWMPRLLREFAKALIPERQVMYWFEPSDLDQFRAGQFPIFIFESGRDEHVYGFPTQPDEGPGGVKVAFYRRPDPCNPNEFKKEATQQEIDYIRQAIKERIPSLTGELLQSTACLYTMSPDQHFVIGIHPDHYNVVIASPCSGHGFKFCPVVGEILADLATTGETKHPIDLFDPKRFL